MNEARIRSLNTSLLQNLYFYSFLVLELGNPILRNHFKGTANHVCTCVERHVNDGHSPSDSCIQYALMSKIKMHFCNVMGACSRIACYNITCTIRAI